MTWVLCLAGNSTGGLITDLVSCYGECPVPCQVKTRGLAAACNSTVTFALISEGCLRGPRTAEVRCRPQWYSSQLFPTSFPGLVVHLIRKMNCVDQLPIIPLVWPGPHAPKSLSKKKKKKKAQPEFPSILAAAFLKLPEGHAEAICRVLDKKLSSL